MYQSARKSFQWKLSWLGGFGTALWMCWGFYTEPEVAFVRLFLHKQAFLCGVIGII